MLNIILPILVSMGVVATNPTPRDPQEQTRVFDRDEKPSNHEDEQPPVAEHDDQDDEERN